MAEQPNPRDAVGDRREQIADEPRPKPLYVMGRPSEPDDEEIYRLYRPEWVIVYTAVHDPHSADSYRPAEVMPACVEHFQRRYAGRVLPGDNRIEPDNFVTPTMARLLLCLPTMKGEFKHAMHAYDFARTNGWTEFTVVARNSSADHDLRQYGTRKLAAGGP